MKIHVDTVTSGNSEKQDPEKEKERAETYMQRMVDEGKGKYDLTSKEGLNEFNAYLEKHRLLHISPKKGSIIINVTCRNLDILEQLWDDYRSGHLNAVAEKCLITEQVKEELGMETIKLTTIILEDDYLACRSSLEKISG